MADSNVKSFTYLESFSVLAFSAIFCIPFRLTNIIKPLFQFFDVFLKHQQVINFMHGSQFLLSTLLSNLGIKPISRLTPSSIRLQLQALQKFPEFLPRLFAFRILSIFHCSQSLTPILFKQFSPFLIILRR